MRGIATFITPSPDSGTTLLTLGFLPNPEGSYVTLIFPAVGTWRGQYI